MAITAKAFKRAPQRRGPDVNMVAFQLQLKRAMNTVGMTSKQFATFMRFADSGRAVRRYLDGTREPNGPATMCVDLIPQVFLLLERYRSMTEREIFSACDLGEQEADAVIALLKVFRAGVLLGKRNKMT